MDCSVNHTPCFCKKDFVARPVITSKKTKIDQKIESISFLMIQNDFKKDSSRKSHLKNENHETLVNTQSDNCEFLGLRKDYSTLLSNMEGLPWKKIAALKDPTVKEQLIDIYYLCKEKIPNNVTNILDFAFQLATSENEETSIHLGLILFSINRKPEKVCELIKTPESLENELKDELEAVIEKLKKHYLSHAKIGLQAPKAALMTQLPIEIAQLLLTDNGSVNFGIIPYLFDRFVDNQKQPHNHEINLVYTLKMLKISPELREKIAHISEPDSPKAPANRVIRSVLDLPVKVKPTPLHAKQTALTGLLSHLRQGSDGSCFATPLAIWLLSSHLGHCLDDFASLLKSSKLTRKTNNMTRDFPFLLRMTIKSLNTSFQINRKGEILVEGTLRGLICEVPGFQKAVEAISLGDCKKVLRAVMQRIYSKEEETVEIKTMTVKEFLQEFAKYAKTVPTHTNQNIANIFTTAYFAFEGQVNNPLLAVWENAIAGMAEGEESSLVTSAILSTTTNVFNEVLDTVTDGKEEIKKLFSEELQKRVQLQYDPIVPHTEISNDQHTTEGAFVLYDKAHFAETSKWKRIDNPHTFQKFILRILEKIKISDPSLLEAIEQDGFLIKILNNYYPNNKLISKPIANYEQIKYSPWVTKSGNNFSKVIQVYFEHKKQRETQIIAPKNATHLFVNIIELGRQLSEIEKKQYLENSYLKVPARVPGVHAFSLTLGDPTLVKSWDDTSKPEEWILKNVIEPGKKVSESLISNALRKSLIEYCNQNLVGEANREEFLKLAELIDKEQSVKGFRTCLLKVISSLKEPLVDSPSKRAQLLDTHLYRNLPEDLRDQLDRSSVHFADTNWYDGLYDIHFCFTVNPGTGQLEIWAVQDNQRNMLALNQKMWLQEWEIYK